MIGLSATKLRWLKVYDPPEKVVSWYTQKLPSATKSNNDQGETTFTWHPPAAAEHEQVEITVKKGEILISEDVLPGKRK